MIVPAVLALASGALYLFGQNKNDTASLVTIVPGFTLSAKMQNIYNKYKAALHAGAAKINIPVTTAAAILAIESSGNGFAKDGRMIIRFEPHVFKRYTGVQVPFSHKNQSAEYNSFEGARKIDENAAYLSISMGLAQVMGFNHKTLGYKTPKDMFIDLQSDITQQIVGMFKFIGNKKSLVKAAQEGDFATFAHGYNGPGYRANKYDEKMANAKAALEKSGIV